MSAPGKPPEKETLTRDGNRIPEDLPPFAPPNPASPTTTDDQDESQIPTAKEPSQNVVKKKTRGPTQQHIRGLDRYAQCPHCDLVNENAGNLKTHWVGKNGGKEPAHPNETYNVADVWIFKRDPGSKEPHEKKRNVKGKVESVQGLTPVQNQAIVKNDQPQPGGSVKSEATYVDRSGQEPDPQDDVPQDRVPSIRRSRNSLELNDLDFMDDETHPRRRQSHAPSVSKRVERMLTRQPRPRYPSQQSPVDQDDDNEDATFRHDIRVAEQATLRNQRRPPRYSSMGLNPPTHSFYQMGYPVQQFGLRASENTFNPAPPNYHQNPYATYPNPNPNTYPGLGNEQMQRVPPPALSQQYMPAQRGFPTGNRSSLSQLIAPTPSSFEGKPNKRRITRGSMSSDERDRIAAEAYAQGFDACWNGLQEYVQNPRRAREGGSMGMGQ